MTQEEFATWVKSVGGTSKAAKILEIAPSQVSNYVHGYRNIGASIELKLKNFLEQSDIPNATTLSGTKPRVWGYKVSIEYIIKCEELQPEDDKPAVVEAECEVVETKKKRPSKRTASLKRPHEVRIV